MTYGTGFWLDVATEFIFTASTTMLGYMTAAQALTLPSQAGWVAAILAGLVGAANHVRALRKPGP